MSIFNSNADQSQFGDTPRLFVVAYDIQAGRLNSMVDFDVDAQDDALAHLREKQGQYAGRDNVEVTLLEGTLNELKKTHARYFSSAPALAVSQALLKHLRRGPEGGATHRRQRRMEL